MRPSYPALIIFTLTNLIPGRWLHASTVIESESNGAATNNTLATAHLLAPADFSAPLSPNIFGSTPTATILGRAGGNDVDVYAFDVATTGRVHFDVDGAEFDSYLALFNAAGTVLAADDDSFPADPGSSTDLDAFLGRYTITAAGRYYIAVSSVPNVPVAAFSGDDFAELTRHDGAFGGHAFLNADPGVSDYLAFGPQEGAAYTLHVSVPAPGTLIAGLAGAGLAARRRRR